MLNETRYQAARMVSETVEEYFTQRLAAAGKRGEKDLASVPAAPMIEAIIDAAFWASLRREEGTSPKISLAFLPPEQAGQALIFEQRIPLTSNVLTKLSPGVERPGVHLGVWYEGDNLFIWGTTLSIPNFCFVLDVSEPGLLVIKYRRVHGLGKFANVAVLIGDQVKVVDEKAGMLPDCPAILQSLLGFSSSYYLNNSINVLIQLAVSMRAHKHGGTLLVVPGKTEAWRESIIHPLKYSIKPAYTAVADLMRQDEKTRSQNLWQSALRKELDSMAGLTAVDGAMVISDQYELLAFGAKITRPNGRPRVEQIIFKEPIAGNEDALINPANSGGTRHLSAAQFVHDQPDGIALVASQDGHFTVFSWSQAEQMVLAHRIDTLLL